MNLNSLGMDAVPTMLYMEERGNMNGNHCESGGDWSTYGGDCSIRERQ